MSGVLCSILHDVCTIKTAVPRIDFIKFVNKEILESATDGVSWKIDSMAIIICMYILNTSHWSYIAYI